MVDGKTYHEFMKVKHAELKATFPNSRERMKVIGQLWREAKSKTLQPKQVVDCCPHVIVYDNEPYVANVIQHDDEEDEAEIIETVDDEIESVADSDDECDDDDDDFYNSIDLLVAKLTSVNKVDSQVFKWITSKLQRKFMSEQDFMDGIYNIYEKNNQHNLKQHIPTDIYQYYAKYMDREPS